MVCLVFAPGYLRLPPPATKPRAKTTIKLPRETKQYLQLYRTDPAVNKHASSSIAHSKIQVGKAQRLHLASKG